MTFPQICKYTATIFLVLGIIGSFYLAKEISTSTQLVPKYEFIASDELILKEVKNKTVYTLVLISSWIGSMVLFLILYGLGEIVEELRKGNSYKRDILYSSKDIYSKMNESS